MVNGKKEYEFLHDDSGKVVVGKYSGNERLDPAQFEEPDADNEYMFHLWHEDCANDPEFLEEMREMIARYKKNIAVTTDPDKIIVHMVGQSHIDVAWKWRYEQTRKKAIVTFKKAVRHSKMFPGTYCFALSEPILLQWILEDDPDLFREIQEAVKAGGIELVGGSYVEPDVMMPSGEAMVRTRLYGQRFYRDHFGQLADVEWFLDSFGYNYGVPQVLVKSGAKYFWTSKITWNRQTVFPFVDFWWQGVDGTQILTTNFSMGYGPLDKWILYEMGRHPVKEGVDLVWNYERDYTEDIDEEMDLEVTVPHVGCFFGKGDGGHGPTFQEVVQANGLASYGDIFKWSRVGEFYKGIELQSARLPIWNDELYLEYHRGTFSVHAEVKRHNRLFECWLTAVEPLAAWVATSLGNAAFYPVDSIEEVWKTLLKNQFHDVLPGSSIPEVYDDVYEDWQESAAVLESLQEGLARHFKTPDGFQFVVYNPLAWDRETPVFIPANLLEDGVELGSDGRPPAAEVTLVDAAGNSTTHPAQPVASEPGEWVDPRPAGWWAVLPLKSLSVTPISVALTGKLEGEVVEADETTGVLDNGTTRVKLSTETGAILEFTSDRIPGVENVVSGDSNNLTEAFEDDFPSDHAWNLKLEYWKYPVEMNNDRDVKLTVRERGPVLSTIEVTHTLGKDESPVTQSYTLFRSRPELFCDYVADWKQPYVMLKVPLETTTGATRCTADVMFGAIERSTTPQTPADRARYEKICHKYYDVSTPEETWGVATLNEGKYAFDASGGRTRLTLLRSPTYPTAAGEAWVNTERKVRKEKYGTEVPKFSGLGPFRCRYAYLPHAGGALRKENGEPNVVVTRAAEEFNYPARVLKAGGSSGAVKADGAPIASITAPNVNLTALKLNEWDKNGDLILRVVETCGTSAEGEIVLNPELASRVKAVRVVDLLEREDGVVKITTADYSEGTIRTKLGKFELKTYALLL
ncbi:MAG: alpha-mannosidase [Promethearchaeota archaeon]